MPRVIHFEIPADEPERAIRFYSSVFGWQVQKWDGPMPYWLVSTGDASKPGINGGLLQRAFPGQGTVNTLDVDDLDATVKSVEAAGGKITMPRMAVPGIGWLAYATDPEGNWFGMMQADPNAK